MTLLADNGTSILCFLYRKMNPDASHSTNNDPPESFPINGSSPANIFRHFGSIFQANSQATNPQYIEFGTITERSPNRTLGTFAGVFCPVALSMFSALLFIRVGFIVGNAGTYQLLMWADLNISIVEQ
jgi:potassium/chloride transporter 9